MSEIAVIIGLVFCGFMIGIVVGFLLKIDYKGLPLGNLNDGEEYEVFEKWSSGEGTSFLLKLSCPNYDRHRNFNFYLIQSWTLRNRMLEMIPLDQIPTRFKVKRKEILLPEDLPVHNKKEVFVLYPVSEEDD